MDEPSGSSLPGLLELHSAGREKLEPGNGHRLGGKVAVLGMGEQCSWMLLRGLMLLKWKCGRWGEGWQVVCVGR